MKKIILALFIIAFVTNQLYPIGQCHCINEDTECGILIDSDAYIGQESISNLDQNEFVNRFGILESRCEAICNENSLSYQGFGNYGPNDIEHLDQPCLVNNPIYQIFPSEIQGNNVIDIPSDDDILSDNESDSDNNFGFDDIFED